jgi:hypothetical protein
MRRTKYTITASVVVLLAGLLSATSSGSGMEISGRSDGAKCAVWSDPVKIHSASTWTDYADLAVDPAGSLHAVWQSNLYGAPDAGEGEILTSDYGVYYSYLEANLDKWSNATDILGPALYPRIVVDDNNVHVFRLGECFEYSKVPITAARSAASWFGAGQICVGDSGSKPAGAVVDGSGGLHAAWPESDRSVLYSSSSDGGRTWSAGRTVAGARGRRGYVGDVRLALGNRGEVHVVWTYWDYNDASLYGVGYARSNDNGVTWSDPVELANGYSVQPNVAVNGDEVHVVWNGTVNISKRFHRYSTDGGTTWSKTLTITDGPTGGILDAPGLVIDSAGLVHVLVATDSGAFYVCWDGSSWTRPQEILKGIPTKSVALVLDQGNQLHALVIEPIKNVWYLSGESGGPRPPIQRPTTARPTAMIEAAKAPTPTSGDSPAARSQFHDEEIHPGPMIGQAQTPIVLGAACALTLILGSTLLVLARRHTK